MKKLNFNANNKFYISLGPEFEEEEELEEYAENDDLEKWSNKRNMETETPDVYVCRNVGDYILEVLPITLNNGMTTGEIIRAMKEWPNATEYSGVCISIGLTKYLGVIGVSGYRICIVNSPYPQLKTYYKRRNGD